MKAAALAFASQGIAVFRLKPGTNNRPMDRWKNGPSFATTSTAAVEARWTDEPQANIGVPNGQQLPDGSYLALLDIDLDVEGAARPAWAVNTLASSTPSGGLHLWYVTASPVTPRMGAVAVGVDVPVQVCAPPSVRPTGCYRWVNDLPMTQIDTELFHTYTVDTAAEGIARPRTDRKLIDDIKPGERHRQLALWGAWFRKHEPEWETLTRELAEALYPEGGRDADIDGIVKWLGGLDD